MCVCVSTHINLELFENARETQLRDLKFNVLICFPPDAPIASYASQEHPRSFQASPRCPQMPPRSALQRPAGGTRGLQMPSAVSKRGGATF